MNYVDSNTIEEVIVVQARWRLLSIYFMNRPCQRAYRGTGIHLNIINGIRNVDMFSHLSPFGFGFISPIFHNRSSTDSTFF